MDGLSTDMVVMVTLVREPGRQPVTCTQRDGTPFVEGNRCLTGVIRRRHPGYLGDVSLEASGSHGGRCSSGMDNCIWCREGYA